MTIYGGIGVKGVEGLGIQTLLVLNQNLALCFTAT